MRQLVNALEVCNIEIVFAVFFSRYSGFLRVPYSRFAVHTIYRLHPAQTQNTSHSSQISLTNTTPTVVIKILNSIHGREQAMCLASLKAHGVPHVLTHGAPAAVTSASSYGTMIGCWAILTLQSSGSRLSRLPHLYRLASIPSLLLLLH